MRLKWHANAAYEIEGGGCITYIDPYLLRGQLPKADVILVSHEHEGHLDVQQIQVLWKDSTRLFVPQASADEIGFFHELTVVEPGSEFKVNDLVIDVVAAHTPTKQYHREGRGVGYILTLEGKRVYFAGATDVIPAMNFFEGLDIAILPISGYRTMNIYQALEAVKLLDAHIVIPMMYDKNLELLQDAGKFKQLVESETSSIVELLGDGELYF